MSLTEFLTAVPHRTDSWLRQLSPRVLFWSIVLVNLVLILGVLLLALLPSAARFTIDAETQIVTVDLPRHEQAFAWGKLPVEPESIDSLPSTCANPQIDLSQPLNGPLTMQARSLPETGIFQVTLRRFTGKSVGTLNCEDGRTVESGPYVRLVWAKADQHSVTLRFLGIIEAGRAAPEGSTDYLKLSNGRIVLESQNVRSETPLFMGDSVRLYALNGKNQQAIAHGLVEAKSAGSLHLIAHAEAREARVIHEGQEGETASSVAPSFWTKLQAQTWLVIIGAFLLNMLSALRAYRDEVVQTRRASPSSRKEGE